MTPLVSTAGPSGIPKEVDGDPNQPPERNLKAMQPLSTIAAGFVQRGIDGLESWNFDAAGFSSGVVRLLSTLLAAGGSYPEPCFFSVNSRTKVRLPSDSDRS
jgi:hypothetical protein